MVVFLDEHGDVARIVGLVEFIGCTGQEILRDSHELLRTVCFLLSLIDNCDRVPIVVWLVDARQRLPIGALFETGQQVVRKVEDRLARPEVLF